MKSIEMNMRRAGHAQVEISGDRQVVGELRIFQVPHPRRADARFGQPVVEPGGRAVAEVGADRLVNRREHLEQDEDDADEGEPVGEAVAALDGGNEHAHGDREDRRQHAPQHEDDPPDNRERAIRLRQHGEKLPLFRARKTSNTGSAPMSKRDPFRLVIDLEVEHRPDQIGHAVIPGFGGG